uniref:Uncharacterized protein n=1 Tax=Hucho hucho TaxID=62062 RepID=A0A4W5K1C3_9TELE
MQPVPNIDHLLSNIGRTGLPGSEASDSTTSDSPKDKCTWGARDLSARDFLPLSIISAVTRKRKIRPISRPLSSSTDEDSEHEPIKASNYGVGGGAKEEEEEGVGEGCTPNGTEKVEKKGEEECRKRIEAKQESDRGREKEGERKKEGSAWVKDKEVASPKPHPNSFLYTHYQPTTTSPSPPVEPSVSPHSKLPSLARGRSAVPSWLSPSRQPGPSRPYNTQKTQQPQLEQQPLPVQYRKTRGVRARPQSMNLDMVMGKGEGGVGRRGDRVKVVRATTEVQRHRSSSVGVPQGCVVASLKVQGSSRLASALAPSPVSSLSPPLPSSSFSPAWTDQGSLGSTVVMRRSALEPRDKRKAWRRHTVVV